MRPRQRRRDVEVESTDVLRARAVLDPRVRLDIMRGEATEDVVERRVSTYLAATERQAIDRSLS